MTQGRRIAYSAHQIRRAAAVRPPNEPVEREQLVNDALDLIEGHVRTVIDQGGKVALHARLDRLLGGYDQRATAATSTGSTSP